MLVWPGFGLVIGAGLGTVAGLLLSIEWFFVGPAAGAGLGLVFGAIIEQSTLVRRGAPPSTKD